MSPGILFIPYPGLIIPVRFSISIALLFVSIKANVVASSQALDWITLPGHLLLLVNALVNAVLAGISLALAAIREEDELSPVLRWKCACCAIIVRIVLFPVAVWTIIAVAESASQGHLRVNELVLAEVTLGIMLYVLCPKHTSLLTLIDSVCYIVGLVRKVRVMQEANAAGEEEVQKEIVKQRVENRSNTNSNVSTPQSMPTIMSHSPEADVDSLYIGHPAPKFYLNSSSTDTLKTPADSFYERSPMNSASLGSSQDKFSTHSYA